jgi:transposase InsO family protein
MDMTRIDSRQALISDLHHSGHTTQQILHQLRQEGVKTSGRSLGRRLQEWGLTKQPELTVEDEDYPHLVEVVGQLFHHNQTYRDTKIAERITEMTGIRTSIRQVKEIRLRNGWLRRTNDISVDLDSAAKTRDFIQELLQQGEMRTYGRRQVLAHLTEHYGFKARGDHVRQALQYLDSLGVAVRNPLNDRGGLNRTRNFTVKGPNWLWCLDGHDKLKPYGFEIYGCVDAYSRKIIWFFVGSSNATAVSVLKQYLQAVKTYGCPNRVRSDEGREVPMMADAHYYFYYQALLNEHAAGRLLDEDLDRAIFEDCWIFGKSTANIRIESLWGRLIRQVTGQWIELFHVIEQEGFYRSDLTSDRVIFAYVFMPMIRTEIFKWVQTTNARPIRDQSSIKERGLEHLPGVPNDLFIDGPQQGFRPCERLSQFFEAKVEAYGTFSFPFRQLLIYSGVLDHDEYLPGDTIRWCDALLESMQLPSPPVPSHFISSFNRFRVPNYFKYMINTARTHTHNDLTPPLHVSIHPVGAWSWVARNEVLQQLVEERSVDL